MNMQLKMEWTNLKTISRRKNRTLVSQSRELQCCQPIQTSLFQDQEKMTPFKEGEHKLRQIESFIVSLESALSF